MSFILAGDSDDEVLRSFTRLKKEDLRECKDIPSVVGIFTSDDK